jgi:hypothetical protein
MTGQDIVDAVSSDLRGMLASTGNDATIILGWVDRVHKQVLRTSRWRFLLSPIETFTTTTGQARYYFGAGSAPADATDTTLALSDVQFIKARSVVDRTNDKRLGKTDEEPLGETWKQNGRPDLYKFDSQTEADVLQLMPPPDGAYDIEFRYYKARIPISALDTVLQIPDDYKDIVVAGVNQLALVFLKKTDEVTYWMTTYKDGLREMVRDANLFPREDFIRPDYVAIPHSSPSIYEPFQEQF